MGPMAEPPEFVIKLLLGFFVLMVGALVGNALLHIEKSWPFVLGFFASWLVGHLLFKAEEWHEKRKNQKWADDFYARHPDNRDASKTAEDRIRADAERQKLEEMFRRPSYGASLHRHTQQQAPTSDSVITPIIMGAAAGYAAGSYASSHSDSCSSDSSGSASSDSGSCGGE